MVTPFQENTRPGRIIPDLNSKETKGPRNTYLIPFVPTEDDEKGSIFRAEHCFDANQMACPLYYVCSLVLNGNLVTGAKLDMNYINLLPEDSQTDLKREMLDPAINEKVVKSFTVSSLNDSAFCTKEKEIDPLYNKQKTKVILPPMPEDPPFNPEDDIPPFTDIDNYSRGPVIKETEIEEPANIDIDRSVNDEVHNGNTLPENNMTFVAEKLPGFEDEPPQFDSEFDLLEAEEMHPDNDPSNDEGDNDDIGIDFLEENKEEPPVTSDELPQNNSDTNEDDDDEGHWEFEWQKWANR